ncbi:response regulator [Opitutus sp. ER46]|uniref:response regulator n=1 Tax=Opitutus sp. ER46 TaxID=2161864 RepID=UPI000D3046F4|nr:response regulator [Opitutus sp. ER46]PTX94574.1 hybrid sensor histidine kinase/response regulator [Opitutus sp. ER46]
MNSPAPTAESRVLVIDDCIALHDAFRQILLGSQSRSPFAVRPSTPGVNPGPLRASGFAVDCVAQGEEGIAAVRRALDSGQPYAIAFVDMRMPPGVDGIETTRRLWEIDPQLQVIICTGVSDHSWESTVLQLGATDNLLILKKPFDKIEVLQMAHALATKWLTARRDRALLADLDARVRQQTSELNEAEGRFANVFHANPVPTALQSAADGRFVDVNPAFLDLVGLPRDRVVRHTSTELGLWPEQDVWRLAVDSIHRRAPWRSQSARLRSGRGMRDVLVSVEKVQLGPQPCVLTSIEDDTDRLLLEKKFQQAQKMEAVGQLAAGVAHDFNNLLTVIQSYTALVLDDAHLSSTNRDGLAQVNAAASRAAALTRQLLIFSRRQITNLEAVDLAHALASTREMLRRLLPEHTELVWDSRPGLPRVMADIANLEQVVMNLAVNARDAMPRGGKLTIRLAAADLGADASRRHPDARPGRFVQLTVSDTGLGMSADVMSHLFEPFFTTKEAGKGTGLGLPTVYAIVRQHSGWTEVTSMPARGTRFDVYLPALPAAPSAPPSEEPAKPTGESLVRGKGERILLVEDEPSVRLTVRIIAQRAGYDVTEAVDGPDALRRWQERSAPFDLLFTDMVMPNGMNGVELAAKLREEAPDLPVVISTGYSQELLRQNGTPVAGARLLLKPFTTAALLDTLREILAAPR